MNLHIAINSSFILDSFHQFEKYYPNKNHYFIQISRNDNQETYNKCSRIHYCSFLKKKNIRFIETYARENKTENVFVHFLTPISAIIANRLRTKFGVKLYWIFFGIDLYELLANKKQGFNSNFFKELMYSVYFGTDYGQARFKFIKSLDFFCFWNNYDFELLINNFETSAKHKYFIYSSAIVLEKSENTIKEKKILINHASSLSGNHLKIFSKLKNIGLDKTKYQLLVPLSYGNQQLRDNLVLEGKLNFGNSFLPITKYLSKEEYFKIIQTCEVAIFGHKKQEAAANVFYLLNQGVKLFLRDSSSLFNWLKDRGFIVFSFDKDLNSLEDIRALNSVQRNENCLLFNKYFSENVYAKMMDELIN